MRKTKKKTQREEIKEESLLKWIMDPKSPAYIRKKLLEAIESGT
jgi:hypothetical protein